MKTSWNTWITGRGGGRFRACRMGWFVASAILLSILISITTGAAVIEQGREQMFGLEKMSFRIEYLELSELAEKIHPYFSPEGWYRVRPSLRVIEICDSSGYLDTIQELIEQFDANPIQIDFTILLMRHSTPTELQADNSSPPPDSKETTGLSRLNRRVHLRKEKGNESNLGRKSLVAGEGDFVEFTIGQVYNVALQVGYFDKKKELIEIKRLTFALNPTVSKAVRAAGEGTGDKKSLAVGGIRTILSTGLKLENGKKTVLTMRKPGSKEFYTLVILARTNLQQPSLGRHP